MGDLSEPWKRVDSFGELEKLLEEEGLGKDIAIFFSKVDCPACDGVKMIFAENQVGFNYISRADVLSVYVEKKSLDEVGDFIRNGYEFEGFPYLVILDGRIRYGEVGKASYWFDIRGLIIDRNLKLASLK